MSAYKVDDIVIDSAGDKLLVVRVSDNMLYVVDIDAIGSGSGCEGWMKDFKITKKLSHNVIRRMIIHREMAIERLRRGMKAKGSTKSETAREPLIVEVPTALSLLFKEKKS